MAGRKDGEMKKTQPGGSGGRKVWRQILASLVNSCCIAGPSTDGWVPCRTTNLRQPRSTLFPAISGTLRRTCTGTGAGAVTRNTPYCQRQDLEYTMHPVASS